MILGAKSLGAHGYGTENFSFPAAHAGKSWAILGSPNLWPRAALAAGQPGCLSTIHRGAGMRALCVLWPGSRIAWGRQDTERGLDYRHNAQLDEQKATVNI